MGTCLSRLALCLLPLALAACGDEPPPGPPVDVTVYVQDSLERMFPSVTFTEGMRVLPGRCEDPADLLLPDGGIVDQHGSTPCARWVIRMTPGTHVLGVAVRHYVTEYLAIEVVDPGAGGGVDGGVNELHVQMAHVHYVRTDAGID